MVGVGDGCRDTTVWARDVLRGEIGWRRCAGEHVELLLGSIVESGDIGSQIFCHCRFRSSEEKLRGEERDFFGKSARIEDGEEFGPLGESLDGVGQSGGKIPDVSCVEIVVGGLTVSIDGADSDAAVEDVGPFVVLVPMEFAVGVWGHLHVYASHLRSCWKLVDVLLTCESGLS